MFLVSEMDAHDPKTSAGDQTLDRYEYFLLWKYCRKIMSSLTTSTSLKGLLRYALKHDFCEPEDLRQFPDDTVICEPLL